MASLSNLIYLLTYFPKIDLLKDLLICFHTNISLISFLHFDSLKISFSVKAPKRTVVYILHEKVRDNYLNIRLICRYFLNFLNN